MHNNHPVRLRGSIICIHHKCLLLVQLKDPTTYHECYYTPGGKLEEDEDFFQAAVRETKEETGYAVTACPAVCASSRYVSTWGDKTYLYHTHYFRATLAPGQMMSNPERVIDASYHQGAIWVPVEQVKQLLSFDQQFQQTICTVIS